MPLKRSLSLGMETVMTGVRQKVHLRNTRLGLDYGRALRPLGRKRVSSAVDRAWVGRQKRDS